MSLLFWFSLALLPQETPAPFTFQDVTEVDGRSVTIFRPVEFVSQPVRPLQGSNQLGSKARYGLLPVGTHPENALAVVWEPEAKGGPVLWLDADGDGILTAAERHAFSMKEISLPFSLVIRKGEGEDTEKRTVVFRRSSLGSGLSYAVRGCFRGRLAFDKETYPAVLVDANGDGCFHGAGVDRLWIDLNRDGHFDPLTEQFTLGRPMTVNGVAYIVAADPLGKMVRARRRGTETGRLRMDLPSRLQKQVRRFHADLLNDLGEMISLTSLGQAVEVPSSTYRLAAVTLDLEDSQGRRWQYSFASWQPPALMVRPNAEAHVTILDQVTMTILHDGKAGGVRPGADLTLRPYIQDRSGLYPTLCSREENLGQQSCTAEVRLRTTDGIDLGTFTSGFN
jgi:hypothetical protein